MAGETIKPRDARELRQAVEWALSDGITLDVRGSGSKLDIGKPMRCDHILDLSGVSGIVDYAPEELVVTLRAGTPMREVEALLAQRNQMLAFEPPDLGPLLGREAGEGTLVGTIMGNFAGPRRLSAGAARDHLLGFSGVNGRGEAFKSGGRVMKNVTGYDLSKLLAGSWGTLAVLDEVSVKVMPAPDQTRTLLLYGLDEASAVKAMCAAMGSPHEVSGAAHVGERTALRVEGVAPSVEARVKGLRDLFRGAEMEELETFESRAFWRDVRDGVPLGATADAVVWRISCAPSDGASVVATIRATCPAAKAFYDWSGGLIWLALPAADDAWHELVRAGLAGHATLIRAPETVRAAVPVFQPQQLALAALSARVKESFDPNRLFNPGRMEAISPMSIYDLFVRAMVEGKQVSCLLGGHPRVFSVIILGHRHGDEVALVWQTAGSSSRGLPPGGAWRNITLSDVRDAKLLQEGKPQSGDSHKTEQSWVTDVDLDVNPRSPYHPRRQLEQLRRSRKGR